MKSDFNIPLPWWLNWLIPQRLRDDLSRRSRLTGTARKVVVDGKWGGFGLTCERLKDDETKP